MNINKDITNISLKEWHSLMQQLHLEELQKRGVEAITEKRLYLTNGHKSYRKADIYVPELNLVIEVQKSKFVPKDFRERNEDYQSLGLRVIWILNKERWEPDSMQNPELANESDDIYIKWKPFRAELGAQHTYNSNRYFIVDYWKSNSNITIYYCLPTADGMMYRKLDALENITRELTPKFPDAKHYGGYTWAAPRSKEVFEGYKLNTTISSNQTIPMDFIR